MSDPLYWFAKFYPTKPIHRPAINDMYNAAYQSSFGAIPLAVVRAELSVALTLHPKLNHLQTFRTLYPDLMVWTEYHNPSQRAEDLVGAVRTKIAHPVGFEPERVHLKYEAGKWSLRTLVRD